MVEFLRAAKPMRNLVGLAWQFQSLCDRQRPLEAAFNSIAQSINGVVGVTALDLHTGRSVSLNGEQRFPMASLVKVPLAMAAMRLVDEGKFHLAQMVALKPSHVCAGGPLSSLHVPGVSLSLRNLIELSLMFSDNTATDALLDTIGGPRQVRRQAPAVARTIRSLLTEMLGIELSPEEAFSEEMWRKATRHPYPSERLAAIRAFLNDVRDTTTAGEMCQTLSQIWRCEGLSRGASNFILGSMRKCSTGPGRLKARLPQGTRFAHKTGSLKEWLSADMGIIDRPGGPVAVCAFVMGSAEPQEKQDRALARLGRVIYDAGLRRAG
jgi:beta-lactamase class A